MKQARTLSKAELQRVLAVITAGRHAQRNRIMILLSFYAGMRVKEIAALQIRDVFDANRSVKKSIQLAAEQTKGKKGRVVVLNKKLQKELLDYYVSMGLKTKNNCLPLLLSQKSNQSFSANSMCQLFSRIYSKAGICNASSHSGRRTFITNIAHKGVSAKVLMTLAGHQHLNTTQRYIDVNDAMLEQAVELI